MAVDERGERSQILLFHLLKLLGLREYLLNQQGIDIDQTDLQEVQRECRQLLLIQPVGGKIAALAVKDETVGPVPVLDDVEPLVNLPSECL